MNVYRVSIVIIYICEQIHTERDKLFQIFS